MTPDRTEHTPDEPENGVLSDTGSIDTTGLGILGGATAQVSVELPSESEDDLADDDVVDDVIDDAVPFVIEIPADADLPVADAAGFDEPAPDTTEAEIVEELHDEDTEAVVEEVEAVDAELVEVAAADDAAFEPDIEDATDTAEAEAAADEALVTDEAPVTETEPGLVEAEIAAEPVEPIAEADEFAADDFDTTEFDDAEFDDADFGAEFDIALAQTAAAGDDDIATADPAEEPMSAHTPDDDATDASAPAPSAAKAAPAPRSASSAARTASGSASSAHAEVDVDHPERAVERAFPRADVTLTSKRLGEFEPDRETADLLTADRLLDPHQVVRPEPEGMWQHLLYSISGRRINLGDSKRAKARKDLDRRIAAPLSGGARFVPVLSRKGGVGKTTVTTLLGMALADARDDRVIAVDANPDRGTLAERISRESGKTVRDLVRVSGDVVGFNDLSNIVARDETRLDVVASDTDPRVSEAFNDTDYRDVATLAAHYYSVVLTDTGTGIVHSVMGATLDLADQLVIVAGLSVDEARLASETLTWLETNGYADKVRSAVVVLNNARPGQPLVQLDELESHFRTRVRSVVRVPYDSHIAAGSAIVFRELQPATRDAARELAATVVEGLRSLATAA